jgi:hypothetical protein
LNLVFQAIHVAYIACSCSGERGGSPLAGLRYRKRNLVVDMMRAPVLAPSPARF